MPTPAPVLDSGWRCANGNGKPTLQQPLSLWSASSGTQTAGLGVNEAGESEQGTLRSSQLLAAPAVLGASTQLTAVPIPSKLEVKAEEGSLNGGSSLLVDGWNAPCSAAPLQSNQLPSQRQRSGLSIQPPASGDCAKQGQAFANGDRDIFDQLFCTWGEDDGGAGVGTPSSHGGVPLWL